MKNNKEIVKTQPKERQELRCLDTARHGLQTGADINTFLSLMITDLAEGTLSPISGNVMCNATGKLLKNVELHLKYGTKGMSGEGMKMATLPKSSIDAKEK